MVNEIDKATKKHNRGNPNWTKGGKSPNPKGREKGSYAVYTLLSDAIQKVEKQKGINILEHFVDRAMRNDTVLVALLKKLVPDRQNIEGENLQRIIEIVYGYRKQGAIDNSSIRKELGGDSPST